MHALLLAVLLAAGEDYTRLQKWQFSSPVPLPAGGITFTRDTATWTLESGTLRIMQPTTDGTITGFAFEGRGRFRMTIPDPYELAQFRRFTNAPKLEGIDQPITQVLVRSSGAAGASLPELGGLKPAAPQTYAPYSWAAKKHESWLVDLRLDADARVLLGLLNAQPQLVIGMQTADYGWITYEYDAARDEEISLTHFEARLPEIWLSLDAPEHRRADGTPGPAGPSAPATLTHVDVKADLTREGRSAAVSRHQQRPIAGRYVVEQTFAGAADSVRALRLGLWSRARELKAFGPNGEALTLFRDHVGQRAAAVDDRIHDDDFVVVLPAPLARGETQRIRFEYELETFNYAPGGIWYPMFRDALDQKHTARLELTVRKRNEARAMGRLESRREDERGETTVWVVARPATMITFSTATRFEEVKLEPQGVPAVVAFGPDYQFGNTQKLRNVGADVANSVAFFQKLLGLPIEVEPFYVTSIAANHGQAFDGFLHMGEFTFAMDRPGASELFRAHEVAHEWWGHRVGWRSYRDQWLSEAFAEYCAMLFVERTMKDGPGYFAEILRSYTGIVNGNFAGGFSKFNRPWLIERNIAERNRIGPIGHGRRAATRDVPFAYTVQAYHKGPLVLHMLRMLLLYRTSSDQTFFTVLREFANEQNGRQASTEDFRRVLERNTGSDWKWFFDSWIYRAEVPSYRWKYDVKPVADGVELTLDLERRDVSEGFRAV
ncbi:MAG TPA: M1 family aminopeptidase, partial [Thermoanaerobaculia bacterium]|nr:M1 family aminopeptidase [Thermoanaerobaculia bacterium]